MRCIQDMRLLQAKMHDRLGRPLLPDLKPEQYLSPLYAPSDLSRLMEYGLREMNYAEFVDRLERDMKNGASSVMRNPSTDDDWHTYMAHFLLAVSDPKYQPTWTRIGNINLIPIMGGEWVSAASMRFNPVNFTHVQGYALPTDGLFRLILPRAERNAIRKRLFTHLGVKEQSLQVARTYIMAKEALAYPGLENSRSHLHFLYLTAHLDRDKDSPSWYVTWQLLEKESGAQSVWARTWYFPDEGLYSPQRLLAEFNPSPSILHPEYMHGCPEKPDKEARSWREWLSAMLSIRDTIPLTSLTRSIFSDQGFRSLSPECLHIAGSCSHEFLPFLLRSWKTEGPNIASSPSLVKALLDTEVLCENGRMYPLGKTYVRTAQIQYVDGFLQDGEFFPWLKVTSSDEVDLPDIGVLTTALGFGYPKSDLEFYITILEFVADANRGKAEVVDVSRIFALYNRIETRYHESVTRETSAEMIVYVPHMLSI